MKKLILKQDVQRSVARPLGLLGCALLALLALGVSGCHHHRHHHHHHRWDNPEYRHDQRRHERAPYDARRYRHEGGAYRPYHHSTR